MRSVPLVFTDHGRYPWDKRGISLLVQRWSATAIDCLVAVSAPLAEQTRTLLRLKKMPQIIENGIDLARYAHPDAARRRSLRAEWAFEETDVVVAIVGRLEPVKNHEGLFEAFRQLSTKGARLGIVALGAGSLEPHLRTLAASLRIASRVRFLGFRDDIPECLLASDVLAMPSHTEGLPLALLEGMAAGLPVVASQVGGIADALGDYPAELLIPPGDTPRLALALERLATDGSLRARLGVQVRTRANAYSLDAMTSAYEALYHTCGDPGRSGLRNGEPIR
jgi:glycosyltransferase involved in cell wall biosynthesis